MRWLIAGATVLGVTLGTVVVMPWLVGLTVLACVVVTVVWASGIDNEGVEK